MMDIQHEFKQCGHATYARSMRMQHGNVVNTWSMGQQHEAWTWTCIMDMDIQQEHGHAAETSPDSMDMDKQY
jgi:hypothetical protein